MYVDDSRKDEYIKAGHILYKPAKESKPAKKTTKKK